MCACPSTRSKMFCMSLCLKCVSSKGQPTEWETIFANHRSAKRLISRIYRGRLKLGNKKTHLVLKWTLSLERHFSREGIPTANEHVRRGSTSLIITETNSTMGRLSPTGMAIMKKQTDRETVTAVAGMWKNQRACARPVLVEM